MSGLSIRAAEQADVDPVASILSGWIDATAWMPRLHTLDEDRAFVARLIERGSVHIAGLGADVVGFMSQQDDEIDALYVSIPGEGIGSRLLKNAQSINVRLTLWTFAANRGARRFYARHGFIESDTTDGDNDEGLPDVRMSWEAKTDV